MSMESKVVPMFSAEELNSLDRKYFNVIAANEYDVTIMSRNTGHYWYLHNPEYPKQGTVIIFHSHHADKTNGSDIICTAERTFCDRRYGVSGDMTSGR